MSEIPKVESDSVAVMRRFEPIVWLADDAVLDIEHLQHIEIGARRVHETYGVLPTIGCEVEVKWSSVFPEEARKYFGEQDNHGRFERSFRDLSDDAKAALGQRCDELNAIMKPAYQETVTAGIPAGSDAYWEFANRPAYAWQTLSTEVQLLMRRGLIPVDYPHSLHVTLGTVRPEGGGMCLVLAGLELVYVAPERISLAVEGNTLGHSNAWARRGQDGIRKRLAGKIEMGHAVATELRTLTVSTPQECQQIFSSTQLLTASLLAYRNRQSNSSHAVQDMADLWVEYRSIINELWRWYDLPAESWGSPQNNQAKWQQWAAVLAESRQPDTKAHDVVEKIGDIVLATNSLLSTL